jgi:hypothetical protein
MITKKVGTDLSKEAKAQNFRILAPKLEKLARKNEKNKKTTKLNNQLTLELQPLDLE